MHGRLSRHHCCCHCRAVSTWLLRPLDLPCGLEDKRGGSPPEEPALHPRQHGATPVQLFHPADRCPQLVSAGDSIDIACVRSCLCGHLVRHRDPFRGLDPTNHFHHETTHISL